MEQESADKARMSVPGAEPGALGDLYSKGLPYCHLTHRLQIRCSAVRSTVRINNMSRSLDRKHSTKHRKQLFGRVMEKVQRRTEELIQHG